MEQDFQDGEAGSETGNDGVAGGDDTSNGDGTANGDTTTNGHDGLQDCTTEDPYMAPQSSIAYFSNLFQYKILIHDVPRVFQNYNG